MVVTPVFKLHINHASQELREMIIKNYIILLRPFGEKIRDFFFMSFDGVINV